MGEIQILESMDGKLFLMHEGVSKLNGAPGPGSGRYPLGSGKRPFQNASPSEQKKARELGLKSKKSSYKVQNEEELIKKGLSEEEKKRIINEGDVKAAYEHRKELTNADIDAVIARREKETRLSSLLPVKKKGLDYIENLGSVLQTTATAITGATNAWNAVANINNAFNKNWKMHKISK